MELHKVGQGWIDRYPAFIVVALVDHVPTLEFWKESGTRNVAVGLCVEPSPLSSSTCCFFLFEAAKDKKVLWRCMAVVFGDDGTAETSTLVKETQAHQTKIVTAVRGSAMAARSQVSIERLMCPLSFVWTN